MRRLLGLFVFVSAAAAGPAAAQSIPSCGAATIDSHIWQAGYNRYVWADWETIMPITGCWLEVQAEGWVNGVGGAVYSRQPHHAYVKLGQPVPSYGRWESTGKHWVIYFGGLMWEFRGETHRSLDMIVPNVAGGGGGTGSCTDPEFGGDPSRSGNGCDSPIIVDVDGDGFALTSVRRGVSFDLDADGVPEQVAWTRPGSDDAWLALDRNGNGIIDDGSELFGNHTPAFGDRRAPVADNGFVALEFTNHPSYGARPSLFDDRIDSRDAIYDRLLLWTDRNHNGFSEPDELQRLADSHIAAISTKYRESRRQDRHGNQFRLRAPSWWTDGSMHPVFDVWLLEHDIAPDTDDDTPED